MAFRADESKRSGVESVISYFTSRNIHMDKREQSKNKLFNIVDRYGPVVDAYPSWHPLVTNHNDQSPTTTPSNRCGYKGLDHTKYFLNAFITCPYHDGKDIIDSVANLPLNSVATIKAERLNVQFYASNANPILISCDWEKRLLEKNMDMDMIPASLAIPLMLKKEVSCWEGAQLGETWETMRPYFLGAPHGSRSSLFVNQETATTMKKIWNLLINTGMFGPIKVSNQN